jgi:exonuclease VII small subunit
MAATSLYRRRGINEFYLSHGFPRIYEELEAVRLKLESIGMYERCRNELQRAEALVRQSPEHDDEAELLLHNLSGDLRDASGTSAEISKKLKATPSATIEDFKADPDGELSQK